MRLKSVACALLATLASTSALADPTGKYTVRGTNPDDGTAYTGTVSVSRNGDTYTVVWTIGENETVGVGLGAHKTGGDYQTGPASEQDSILSVAYSSADTVGAALYYEDPDGTWHGAWAYAGATKSATEVWTPEKPELTSTKVNTREIKPSKALSTPMPVMASPRR